MAAEFERLAYETALRGLDKQEELLRELRSRTGVLLAAASLAASFLKAPPASTPADTWPRPTRDARRQRIQQVALSSSAGPALRNHARAEASLSLVRPVLNSLPSTHLSS